MTEETQAPTKVFISYSWDSKDHKERVLALANTLRNPWGIETDIDQYVRAKHPFTPPQGWDLWMEKRIEWAEFVLIVCTETYQRRFRGDEEPGIGRGSTWEGTIIRQHLYNNQSVSTKFIPVVFSSQDLLHVPIIFNGNDKYILDDEKSFGELCYRLRREPIVSMPDVATAKLPAPPEPIFFPPQKLQAESPPVFLDIAEIQDQNRSPDVIRDNYARLERLLTIEEWKEADRETSVQMCRVVGRQQERYFKIVNIENFPSADLRIIDQLWMKYSNGRFGFSVQKRIWQECGSPVEYNAREANWKIFCGRVGWVGQYWMRYSDTTVDTSIPCGHLPTLPRSGLIQFIKDYPDFFIPVWNLTKLSRNISQDELASNYPFLLLPHLFLRL